MERFQFSILMKVESWERHHYDIEAETLEQAREVAKECFSLSRGTQLDGDPEHIESETEWDWSASPAPIGPYYLYSEDDNGEHLLAEISDGLHTIHTPIVEEANNG